MEQHFKYVAQRYSNVKHQFMAHTVDRGTRVIQTNDIVVF